MNKNINLCEILKGHEGETFYSPLYGDMVLVKIEEDYDYPLYFNVKLNGKIDSETFSSDGKIDKFCVECIIFPSKDQRDWNKWLKEQEPKPPYDACNYTDCKQCSFKTSCLYLKEQEPKVPRTWSEINDNENISIKCKSCIGYPFNFTLIKKSARALLKIHQLIEVGYGGNACPTHERFYTIAYDFIDKEFCVRENEHFIVNDLILIGFHTKEQAEEFLRHAENIQLLKDYFMIQN